MIAMSSTAVQTQRNDESTTRVADVTDHNPSGCVRGITETFLGIWSKRTTPKRAAIAKLRGRIMWGGSLNPIDTLYRISCAAIDEGKPLAVVLQFAKDFIAAVEAYAARRERRTAGILPIPTLHSRVKVGAIREDMEADCAEEVVDFTCEASLEKARAERQQHIDQEQRKVDLYTLGLAQLRARR